MIRRILSFLAIGLIPPTAGAQVFNGVEFSGSGFLTLAAGKVLKGNAPFNYQGYQAPVFIADYGQAGIYEKNKGWMMGPDSRLGLQGNARFSEELSLTAQTVTRGATHGKTDLEWLYGTYHIDNNLTLQIGRKRLPLFYYSETQDVGLSFPWVRLPPQGYGWDIVNYNGASLFYRDRFGDWSSVFEVFAGNETRRNNPYQQIYFGKNTRTDEKWSNIAGTALTLTRDWFESRFAYAQSDWEYWGSVSGRFAKTHQAFYSAAFKIDYGNWIAFSEFSHVDRRRADENDSAQVYALGHRFGKWLPMVTFARYKGSYIDGPLFAASANEAHTTTALTLKYELTSTSTVKLQYDRWKDQNGPTFSGGGQGNPRLLTLSYDLVF